MFTPLYALPVVAAAGVQYRAAALRVAGGGQRVLRGHRRRRSTPAGAGRRADDTGLPPADVALGHGGHQRLRVLRRGVPGRPAGREPALGRRGGRGRLREDRRPRGVQPQRHRPPGQRPGDHGCRRPGADLQPRRRGHHRLQPPRWPASPASDALQLPEAFAPRSSADSGATGPAAVDYTFRRPDGRLIELGVSAAPLPLEKGERGVIFTFQDVTDIKGLERTAQMRQRLAAVGEMAAGIAHEIRNPLASMSGAMQVLRGELPLSAEQAQLMDIVLRESDRLNAHDLVVPRLRAAEPRGRVAHRRAPAGAGHRGAAAHEPRDARRITASTSTVPTAPGVARRRREPAAADRLEPGDQRAEGDAPRRTPRAVRRRRPMARCSIGVRDEGTGIPADEVDAIFHPFRGSFGRGTRPGAGHRAPHRHRLQWPHRRRVGRGPAARQSSPGFRRRTPRASCLAPPPVD